MRGPTDQLREQLWTRAQTIDSEEELTELLNEIEMALRDDLEPLGRRSSRRRAISCAATSNAKGPRRRAGASLASYPTARLSAPASPWPRNTAGWDTKAVGRAETDRHYAFGAAANHRLPLGRSGLLKTA